MNPLLATTRDHWQPRALILNSELDTPASDKSGYLRRDEERRLVERAQRGDRSATERLVEANLRLVYRVARRYHCRSHSQEDLVQEGVLGLIRAIQRFDGARGCRLSTYAMHWIRQAIQRAAEQNDRLIHLPVNTTSDIRRVQRLRDMKQQELGRMPSNAELAGLCGLDEERVTLLLNTLPDAASLEAMVGTEQEVALADMAPDPTAVDPEADALHGVFIQHLRRLLGHLAPRERQIVEERYGFGNDNPRTLEEISRMHRISRERVRQIEIQAIRKLRHALNGEYGEGR